MGTSEEGDRGRDNREIERERRREKVEEESNFIKMPASSLPFSSYNWPGLLKHLHQMLIADSNLEEGINWNIKVDGIYSPSFSSLPSPLIFVFVFSDLLSLARSPTG
jgi:hypothetical protein